MANNNLSKTEKIDQFKGILNTQTIRAQLRNSLKDKAGQFMSSMIDLYSGDTGLQQCDPEKVALECVKAAALDLPIVKSLGYAYVVPYKNVPTFTIGYKGLIQLAQRTGQYKTINSDVVYEGEITGRDKLSGMVNLDGERISDTVVGYFAYFKLLNGYEKVLYMSKEEIEKYAERYSPSYNGKYSPWKSEFDKMACKTVLRQLISKYGPTSTEMQKAELSDDKGTTPKQEIDDRANRQMIDVQAVDVQVDETTGEITDSAAEQPKSEALPFDDDD